MEVMDRGPILFTNAEVYRALHPEVLARALRTAFRDRWHEFTVPPRMNLGEGDSGVLVMPCRSRDHTGIKVSTWRSEQMRAPRVIRAHYTAGDALLAGEADVLTELRTAALSAVVTDSLALPEAHVLGVFGTGRLAAEHVRALKSVRTFMKVLVCGSSPQAAAEFALHTEKLHAIPAEAVQPDRCAAESDVICTCTTAQTPLFDGAALRPGTHLNVLGSFHPNHREVDTQTILRARAVTDTAASALAEAGELTIPIREGSIASPHPLADVHQLLTGQACVRSSEECITLYRGVGFALEDMVAAEALLTTL